MRENVRVNETSPVLIKYTPSDRAALSLIWLAVGFTGLFWFTIGYIVLG